MSAQNAARRKLLDKLGLSRPVLKRTTPLRCPHCAARTHERMVMDHIMHGFRCLWCNRDVRHGPQDHCVYCASGSRKCPEKQRAH